MEFSTKGAGVRASRQRVRRLLVTDQESSCPEHGPHEGLAFVDGYDQQTGKPFGHSVSFCRPCADREELSRRPYRDHPGIKAVRQERIDLRLTLKDVADRMGVHPSRISDLEHGAEPPWSQGVEDYELILREFAKR